MSLETIRNELQEMGVEFKERTANLTEEPEIVIPMTSVSSSKARQIEYLCTSNEGIVSKESEQWVVTNL